jgi:hypothetical protein
MPRCRPQWWRGGAVWHNASARFVRAHRDERDDCRRGFAIIEARLGLSHGGRDGPVHLPGDVAGKGEWRAMMAHELLRQAAQILGAGWSKIADARDDTGRIVPLHAGAGRARAFTGRCGG